MLGGAPPDSFQIHMGHELTDTWVVTGKMEPLDDIYTQMGWDSAFPKGVLDIVSYEGKPYSVPVNIHRANVLWYNKKVFADNGLKPPETFDDFFAVADVLKARGITPLAFADQEGFESVQTFETTAIGVLGAEGYNGLWTGQTAWTGPEMTRTHHVQEDARVYQPGLRRVDLGPGQRFADLRKSRDDDHGRLD